MWVVVFFNSRKWLGFRFHFKALYTNDWTQKNPRNIARCLRVDKCDYNFLEREMPRSKYFCSKPREVPELIQLRMRVGV